MDKKVNKLLSWQAKKLKKRRGNGGAGE